MITGDAVPNLPLPIANRQVKEPTNLQSRTFWNSSQKLHKQFKTYVNSRTLSSRVNRLMASMKCYLLTPLVWLKLDQPSWSGLCLGLTVGVPEDVERPDRVLMQLQVVPQYLDQHMFAVLWHPVMRNLTKRKHSNIKEPTTSDVPTVPSTVTCVCSYIYSSYASEHWWCFCGS